MNFDVRSYCERLAKADPERFVLEGHHITDIKTVTALRIRDGFNFDHIDWLYYNRELWAFVGPLADELGIEEIDRECYYDHDGGVQGVTCQYVTLLEATFAAVVEKLEAGKP